MRKASLTIMSVCALGAGLAACGGSTAPGVQTAPSGGPTQAAATATTTTTATTATTPTVNTPTSGPLSKEPAVTVPKGSPPKHLVVKDLIKGNGKVAQDGSTITVNYVGVLYKNGKVFDASWKRHQTFSIPLTAGSVIQGWVDGIKGMKVGGRRELIIPPSLGYKAAGSPPTIPPNATLIFVVDLLSVS